MGAVQFNPKDYSLNNPIALYYRNNGNGDNLVSLNPKVNGGNNNFGVNPSVQTGQVGGVSTANPLGISTPQYTSHTVAEDGYTKIAMEGVKPTSPQELAYMQEYKGLGNNLFAVG